MSKIGRPLKYDAETLENTIKDYFAQTEESDITITGLCIYLEINKDTFYEYNKREDFKEIIEFAKLRVENSYEKSLRKYGRTGDIFALKNFGWKDKQEVETSGNQDINVNIKVIENGH